MFLETGFIYNANFLNKNDTISKPGTNDICPVLVFLYPHTPTQNGEMLLPCDGIFFLAGQSFQIIAHIYHGS
jgi:hypothetical protein